MLRRISIVFLLLISFVAEATDNAIKMAYNFTTVSQTVVFKSTMQAGGTLTLSAQIADGGGRNPGDPITLKLVFYNSSNQVITTVQQAYTMVLGASPATYSVTATNCGGSCTNVAYVSVQFYGKDGGYWAGNYGPYIQSPVLSFAGGNNILYNPEFGIYGTNGYAQGWASSAGWQNCALYSGAATCVINNGAPVNGGTYSATGGTTSGSSGGYSSVPTSPTTTGTSTGITNAEQTRKNNLITNRNSVSGNTIYIDQAGDNNTVNITQSSGNNSIQGKNQQQAILNGDSNTVTVKQGNPYDTAGKNLIQLEMNTGSNSNQIKLYQGYNADGTPNYSDGDGHIISLGLTGSSNQITVYQTNTSLTAGHYADLNINGNTNNISVTQKGNGSKTLFSTVSGNNNIVTAAQDGLGQDYLNINLTGNGHNVTANQDGIGNHLGYIDLTNSGGASTVNLNQTGSVSQSYSIIQNCLNPNGCSVSVTQP